MKRKAANYTIVIIILSVLLAISLVVGSTFAWFYSVDNATVNLTFGNPVALSIVQNETLGQDAETLPISISGNYLIPGMNIDIYAGAMFTRSTTPAILRVNFDIEITGGTATAQDKESLRVMLLESLSILVQNTGDGNWAFVPHNSEVRSGEFTTGDWWYYLGTNNIQNPTGSETQAEALGKSMLINLDTNGVTAASRTVTFANGNLVFPKSVNNIYAGVSIKFSVIFQSLQAYLPAYSTPGMEAENNIHTGYRYTKIANVYDIFDGAF